MGKFWTGNGLVGIIYLRGGGESNKQNSCVLEKLEQYQDGRGGTKLRQKASEQYNKHQENGTHFGGLGDENFLI